MGRGAQAQTRQLTDQQLALQNAMNRQLYNQNQSLGGTAAQGYRNLLVSPGYSDAEKSAITNQSMGALASAFAALASRAANRTARTRNSAGYGDLLDALAQERGRQTSSLAQQNQLAFADRARQDRLAGLQGLSGLYGVDSSLLGRAMGIPASLLGVRANASRSGTSGLDYLLGQGLGTLGRILG